MNILKYDKTSSKKMNLSNKKILVTGGAGFFGSYVVKELLNNRVSKHNIFIPRSKKIDLRTKENCLKVTKGMDIIIHLAGNVGGIGKHEKTPGEMFYDNISMGINIIHGAMLAKVKKVVVVGTVCSYPKFTPIPFSEEDLWDGYPEETNAPYGLAKKMLLVQSQAYKKQYGLNSIHLIPVNLYGPGDKCDPKTSHVVPSLIRKIYEAKKNNKKYVEVWGDGNASREFLYIEDAAKAVIAAVKKYNKPDPINIGSGKEVPIKSLVSIISEIIGYKGEIRWNSNRPNGQPRRCLNIEKAKKEFGFIANTSLHDGLKKTIDWYINIYG